jgi:hypothetical protein
MTVQQSSSPRTQSNPSPATPPRATLAAWLDENGYDAAPVVADDDPVRLVHRDDIGVPTEHEA